MLMDLNFLSGKTLCVRTSHTGNCNIIIIIMSVLEGLLRPNLYGKTEYLGHTVF
jgi:hypothetical protein